MHALIAMLKHETNTFSPLVTDIERFSQWILAEGEMIRSRLSGTNTATGGYLQVACDNHLETETPVAAEAMPSGPVDSDTYSHLCNLILESLDDTCLAMLDLHGAMVTEDSLDGEGELLKQIHRNRPDLPIAVSLDFHANISEAMVENATIITGYQTYPHTDIKQTGIRAAKLLMNAIRGNIKPVMSFGRLPVLPHTLKQGTDDEPFKGLMAYCREQEQLEGVLDISLFGGFPLADTPYTAPSVIVIVDADLALAHRVKEDILRKAWKCHKQFEYRGSSLESTLFQASKHPGPLVLLDHADNCGSGGTQDVMTIIRALHESDLQNIAVAAVWDPHAVQAMQVAGIDQTITLDLGGKTDMPALNLKGQPLTLTGQVKTLTDGRWTIHGKMYQGVEIDLGPTAVFVAGNLEIIVVSRHVEPWDKGIFIACGINPEQKHYLVLKSRIHHRTSFRTITPDELLLDGTGVTTSDYSQLKFRHLPRPVFPLDQMEQWQP